MPVWLQHGMTEPLTMSLFARSEYPNLSWHCAGFCLRAEPGQVTQDHFPKVYGAIKVVAFPTGKVGKLPTMSVTALPFTRIVYDVPLVRATDGVSVTVLKSGEKLTLVLTMALVLDSSSTAFAVAESNVSGSIGESNTI